MNFETPSISGLIREISELRQEVIHLRSQLPNKEGDNKLPTYNKEHPLPDKSLLDELLKSSSEKDIDPLLQSFNNKLLVMGFISIHKLDGTYLYLSNNFEILTGHNRESIIGKSGYSIMNEQDKRKVELYSHAQNIKGKDTVTNWRVKHAHGHYIWMETFSHIIFDEEKQPAYIYCLSRNVTDKLAVQSKLEQSRKMYNSIYHSSPDALFLLDVNTLEISDCNKRALKLFKYNSKSDVFGKHFSELQQRELSFPEIYRINKRINSKKIWTSEVRCLDSYGNIFEGMMAMRKGDNPDAPFILLRITDLTKLKNTQSVIQQQEQLIASISENVNEGIYRSTLNGKMVYANKAFARIFGYSSVNEVLKIKVEDFYVKSEQRVGIVDKIHKYGILTNEEALFKRKNGESFWGVLSVKLSKSDKGEFYFDGAIKDITESKHYQNQLEVQNQELTEVNNALDRFVYSASHDLRAPIASSLGLIDIALRENNVDIIKEYLKLQGKTLRKLDTFISDIIDYSRNTRVQLDFEEVDFESMVKNAFETYQYMENASTITKNVRVKQTLPFVSDKNRLNIILNNLLSNAIKYCNPYQEQPKINVTIELSEDYANVIIEDNGLGIPEEHLEKIFEMFHRAHPEKKGSGLGLFIVQETVQKLNGSIDVTSKEGEGSTFTLTIPNMAKRTTTEVNA